MSESNQIIRVISNFLVQKEYLTILLFLAFAIILIVLIIGSSYLLARQNPESEKLFAYE